jgi:hypothetical protein
VMLHGVTHAVNPQETEENLRNSTPERRFCCASPSVLVPCLLRFVVLFRFSTSVDAQISLGAVRKTSREKIHSVKLIKVSSVEKKVSCEKLHKK